MSTIAEMLHGERNRLIGQAREIHERATEDGLSAEDQAQFDAVTARAAELNDQVETYMQLEADAERGDKSAELRQDLLGMASKGEAQVAEQPEGPTLREMGLGALKGEHVGHIELRPAVYRDWSYAVSQGATAKQLVERDLSVQTNTAGGHTVPTLVESRFFEVLRNIHGVRQAGADVWTTMGGEPMNLPKAADTGDGPPSSVLVTNEAGEIAAADPTFSVVATSPVKFAGRTYVSRELLEDSATDIEARVVLNLARRIGWLTEYAYHNGSGSGQPQGIMANIPAGNTVTNAAKGTLTYAEILSVKYKIGNYPMGGGMGACWSMGKSVWGDMLGLVGSDGHPIFLPSVMPGYSDMLLGSPVKFNEFTGATDTANAILAIFGDFYNAYVIRDVGSVRIDMDLSHRFIYDQSTYRAILRTDGKLVNSQLLAALKEKAS